MSVRSLAASLAAFALGVALAGPAPRAHDGHDHGAPPPPISFTAAPRAEAASEALELVVVVRGGALDLTLDRFATNEPVEGAAIEVETPAGPATAQARQGGGYRLTAPWAAVPGRYDLLVTVTTDETAEVMTLALTVPELPAPAAVPNARATFIGAALASDLRGRLATRDASFWLVAGGGALAGAALAAFALRRRLGVATAVALAATLITPRGVGAQAPAREPAAPAEARPAGAPDLAARLPDGAVFVPKATQRVLGIRTIMSEAATHRRSVELPGRVIPDPNASGLVQAAVAGRLSPPPGGFPRLGTPVKAGDVLALVTPPLQAIDASDIHQRAGEIDQQIAIVERRLARFRSISDVVSRVQIEEAEIELRGLRTRRGSLDHVRREPEALVAPVAGVVAAANAVAGQVAEVNAVIFQVVDPARLWVEALAYEATGPLSEATARTAGGRSFPLAHRGSGLSARAQAVPVQFALEGAPGGLRVGEFVTVTARTSEAREGLGIPRASVLRGPNGTSIVFEHVGAERFEPREVRVEPLDGTRVLAVAGLTPGRRVVTQGAELLNQVR